VYWWRDRRGKPVPHSDRQPAGSDAVVCGTVGADAAGPGRMVPASAGQLPVPARIADPGGHPAGRFPGRHDSGGKGLPQQSGRWPDPEELTCVV